MSIPAIGIILAFIIGAMIMLIAGYNPIRSYGALFYGGFIRNWSLSILNATPLIFTGLAISIAFRAGLFNIGAEGQYYVGSMAAAILGIYLDIPALLAIPIIFIVSGAFASAYVLIPAYLKIKTGAHEVITTMMFAHIARLLSPIMIKTFGGDPTTSLHPYVTDPILEHLELPVFRSLFPSVNARLHIGILIAVGVAILTYYLINHTKLGFEIRAVGYNKDASKAQGISISGIIIKSLMISGLLAGWAGVNQVLGLNHKMFEDLNAGYGWNGISVALLASNHPIGVIFTAILWGALDAGGLYMQRNVGAPSSIVEIIKGTVLFLLVARYVYTHYGSKLKLLIGRRFKRKNSMGID